MTPGVVVQLKSGGPLMTIHSVDDKEITCTWFDDKHNLRTAKFPEATLEEYDKDRVTTALQLG
jgi:uncharacterized protein YodC (DUF2158 family)